MLITVQKPPIWSNEKIASFETNYPEMYIKCSSVIIDGDRWDVINRIPKIDGNVGSGDVESLILIVVG